MLALLPLIFLNLGKFCVGWCVSGLTGRGHPLVVLWPNCPYCEIPSQAGLLLSGKLLPICSSLRRVCASLATSYSSSFLWHDMKRYLYGNNTAPKHKAHQSCCNRLLQFCTGPGMKCPGDTPRAFWALCWLLMAALCTVTHDGYWLVGHLPSRAISGFGTTLLQIEL